MKKGIVILFVLCVTCLSVALFLQLTGRKEIQNSNEQKQQKTILEVCVWEDERETFDTLAKGFMSQYPEILININYYPSSEYQQVIEIAVNGDEVIDVLAASIPAAAAYMIEKKQIVVLDEMLKEVEMDLSGIEEIMGSLQIEGKNYQLPYRSSMWVVYYNKTIFDAHQLPYPNGNWTWQEYAQIAEQLTDIEKKQYGALNFDINSSWWRIPARTAGASNPLEDEDLLKFKEAAKWNYELTYERNAAMSYSLLTSFNGLNYIERFLNGEAVMMYGGEWCISMLNEQIQQNDIDFTYDVTELPHWEGEETYAIGSIATLMIVEKSKEKEKSMLFLEYVCGEEGASLLAEKSFLPAWNDEKVRQVFRDSMKMPEHTEYFFSDNEISQLPASSDYTEAMNLLHENIMTYLMKEKELEDAMENYKKQLRERTKFE